MYTHAPAVVLLASIVLSRLLAGLSAVQSHTTATGRTAVLGYGVGAALMVAVLHEADTNTWDDI